MRISFAATSVVYKVLFNWIVPLWIPKTNNFFNNLGAPINQIMETGTEISKDLSIPTSQAVPPHEQPTQPILAAVPEDCTHHSEEWNDTHTHTHIYIYI